LWSLGIYAKVGILERRHFEDRELT
jgi:hypothetical protein